jgi:hypothetical protein
MVDDSDWIRLANAHLRYYYHIQEPDKLSDEDWCMRLQELKYLRSKEADNR